ncbi:geranylgeranyl pyrophosphate synthetase [Alternaria alternata]|nr:geranylgeranyl pyrophosphate synthetase [Alternaria alternata]
MSSATMSFESKIALALGGSSWQQLQDDSNTEPVIATEEDEDSDLDDEDEADIKPTEEVVVDPVKAKKQQKKKERFDQSIARDAGEILETIDKDELIPVAEQVVWDRDPELLCCYNWQASDDGTNTIFVPGEPAKWQQPPLPHTLKPDSGFTYSDYNYARQPRNPYLPMFHALNLMAPNTNFHDVDVLADRNNLRILLEFAQGKSNGPFRLNIYLVFNTLVIVRRESRWWKHADGKSYGFNFEKNFTRTTEGMEDATSHYRAIRYTMGPLNVVCRFEADAYDDGIIPDDLTQTEAAAVRGANEGGLAERGKFTYNAPIRVLQKGHIIPTSQMLELKTQAYNPEGAGLVQCQDQLWFGRTSLLFTGPYDKGLGTVNRVKKEDATDRVKIWESKQQESLRKLVALLVRFRDVLKRERRPNRALVLVREGKSGPIVLRAMEERSAGVDREMREKFWPLPTHGNRGRGGGRGAFNGGHRGRGGQFVPAQGRGDFAPSRGRGRGQHDANASYVPRGRGGRGGRGTSDAHSRK